MNRVLIALSVVLVWSVAMFGAGWAWRGDRAERDVATQQGQTATAQAQAQVDARTQEHQQAETMAQIGEQHEQDREAAQAVPDAVVAELRAGNQQLRNEWAGCETQRLSDAAAGTAERDALAASRDHLAGLVVQAGRDADDQLRACQAVVRADRQITP